MLTGVPLDLVKMRFSILETICSDYDHVSYKIIVILQKKSIHKDNYRREIKISEKIIKILMENIVKYKHML